MTTLVSNSRIAELLRKLHRYNAMFLLGFIVLHFITHLSGFWGIEAYNQVQSDFRRIYRNPVIEVMLLVSITAQVILGAKLLYDRLKAGSVSGFWGWLQVISGAYFFVFMAQHLYSLGMARHYFSLDTNFYWPASVMSGPWFIYYFAPYYFLGVFTLFAHIGAGLRFHLIDRHNQIVAQAVGIGFILVGTALGLMIPPIIAGAFFPIELPAEWVNYLRFYNPDFEPW